MHKYFLQIKESYAAQSTEGYSSKINNYPGYKELIDNLKAKYPNWQFKILYTGLDWNQVIKMKQVLLMVETWFIMIKQEHGFVQLVEIKLMIQENGDVLLK